MLSKISQDVLYIYTDLKCHCRSPVLEPTLVVCYPFNSKKKIATHGHAVATQINIVFLILVLISLFKTLSGRAAGSHIRQEKKGMSQQVRVVKYVKVYMSNKEHKITLAY